MRGPGELRFLRDRFEEHGRRERFAVAGVGGQNRKVDERRRLAAGVELIFAVQAEPVHENELTGLVNAQADVLFVEAEPHAQRPLEAHEHHSVLTENRIEALGAKRQGVRESGERSGGIGAVGSRAGRGRRVDRCSNVFAAAYTHRHGDDRIGIELALITIHASSSFVTVRPAPSGRPSSHLRQACLSGGGNALRMPQQRNSLAINTDNRVVSVASRGRNAARIPDTPERQRLEGQRSIREVVFGAQDGILTTLGIVTGVGSAAPDRSEILLTGFLSLLVGAISMGVGEYLGGKSEREVVQNAIDLESREMLDTPKEEFEEQVAYYRLKGFTDDEALMIVRRLEKNPEIWLHEMVRDEFGIDVREAESGGLRASFAMAGSFAVGAAFPVVPYLFSMSVQAAMLIGLGLAVAVLFGIGYFAGTLSARNPLLKGCEIVAFGAAVFAVSWAAGHYVPPLFGHGAVSVGG